MSWNIAKPGDQINGSLVVTGTVTINSALTLGGNFTMTSGVGVITSTSDADTTNPLKLVNAGASGGTEVSFSLQPGSNGARLAQLAAVNDGSGNVTLYFRTSAAGAAATRLTILPAGNVGIGTSGPGQKLDVAGNITSTAWIGRSNGSAPTADVAVYRAADNTFAVSTANTERLRIDASGNLGLGVTPSAWGGGYKAIQMGSGGTSFWGGSNFSEYDQNAYWDGSTMRYVAAFAASKYYQANGAHSWHTAPSGTAGNAIAWNQVMVLDASGNLGLNVTPSERLDVQTTSGRFKVKAYGGASVKIDSSAAMGYNVAAGNGHIFQIADVDIATLNSTGLGVGGSPSDGRLLTVGSLTSVSATANSINVYSNKGTFNITVDGSTNAAGTTISYSWANGGQGPLIFRNAAIANVMTLDGSGNLGLGVTPKVWKSTFRSFDIGDRSAFVNNPDSVSTDIFHNLYVDSGGAAIHKALGAGSFLRFEGNVFKFLQASSASAGASANLTTGMTLDASGNLLVGKTSYVTTTIGVEATGTGFLNSTVAGSTNSTTTLGAYSTGASAFRFYVGMAGTVFATNTTISAISDARLKENVQDIDVGLDAILSLKPRRFDWKAGKGKDIKGDRGFIAQEFEEVFPNLIDEWKDAAPEGEAPYKSVRQDLIPVLVKAIQELTARVQTLENA